MSIRTLSSREVYRNKWLRLREDQIERNNGTRGIYSVVDKQDCAVIVPIDGDHIYLVEQFRYTIQQRCLEMPQGGWEMDNVDPEAMGRGELREETGLTAERFEYLGSMYIAYGFANQRQHVFLAEGFTQGAHQRDAEEHDLLVSRVPVVEFERLILEGRIPDVCTLAAWGLYKTWLTRGAQTARLPGAGAE